MLAIAQIHSERYGYRWHPNKCKIINGEPGVHYCLYGENIEIVDSFKYLGIPFTGKGIDVDCML